jgi:hypothetical protein
MQFERNGTRLTLVIEAIRTLHKLSHRAAVKLFNVPESTLRTRTYGATPIAERQPRLLKHVLLSMPSSSFENFGPPDCYPQAEIVEHLVKLHRQPVRPELCP